MTAFLISYHKATPPRIPFVAPFFLGLRLVDKFHCVSYTEGTKKNRHSTFYERLFISCVRMK